MMVGHTELQEHQGFFVGNDQIGFIELKGAQPFENFKKVIDSQLKN